MAEVEWLWLRSEQGRVLRQFVRSRGLLIDEFLPTSQNLPVAMMTRVGHEKHGRGPCEICGPGACRPKAEGAACQCAFHA